MKFKQCIGPLSGAGRRLESYLLLAFASFLGKSQSSKIKNLQFEGGWGREKNFLPSKVGFIKWRASSSKDSGSHNSCFPYKTKIANMAMNDTANIDPWVHAFFFIFYNFFLSVFFKLRKFLCVRTEIKNMLSA